MVIKGKSVAGAARLAKHLERVDTNERMEVLELRGVAAQDLRGALREMEAVASACPNCQRPFYHASINTRADEHLTPQQREQAIDRLEKELGLTGQPRAVVVHVKEGREHFHIAWSRVDLEKMRTISDSHNYRKHEIVARDLEREFGHERVQGAHIERDGRERPERTPSHKEMQQAARTGVSPKAAREHITALWQRTDSGAAFQAGLEQSGWALARGDRRDFVAIDPKGGTHSLARRIEGATAKDVRTRLADLDIKRLPSVAQAKAAQLARHGGPEPVKAPRRVAAHSKARAPSRTPPRASMQPIRVIGGIARPAGGILKSAGKALDAVATVFEGLLGGGASKPKRGSKNVEKAPLDTGAVPPKAEIEEAQRREQEQQSARRQRYLRDFSREVPDEVQRDADIERDQKERGGRERTRGE